MIVTSKSPLGDAETGVRKDAIAKPQAGDSGGTRDAEFASLFQRRHAETWGLPTVFESPGSDHERRVVDPTTGVAFEGCDRDVLAAVEAHYAGLLWDVDLELTDAPWASEPGVADAYGRFATQAVVAHVRDNWDAPEMCED